MSGERTGARFDAPDASTWKNEAMSIGKLDFDAELMTIAPERPNPSVRRARPDAATVERLRLEDVSVFYGKKAAVKNVSLEINRGEVLALIGRPAAARPRSCARSTGSRS